MKSAFIFAFIFIIISGSYSQDSWKHGRIKVAPGNHYLQYEDGAPFFWLGDTGWELFHRLNLEETETYLENRAAKGFNLIQAVILAEFDGLKTPNQYGHLPLHDMDPSRPNEDYFMHVDTVVKMAMHKGLVMGLLPTWGDKVAKFWGTGPVIFNEGNAYTYGKWLGNRYADYQNIIWILGGDRPPKSDTLDWIPIWRSMAKGILEGTKNKALITYHPSGGHSTTEYIHNEPWLHINMMQSGHGRGRDFFVWDWITRDIALMPAKPVLDAEPNYDDHPISPWSKSDSINSYFREYDVRKQIYRSVFAGACGVTYGHHAVWQFWNPRESPINHVDRFWTEAIDRPGAFQAGYLRALMESRPLNKSIPDQTILISEAGEKGNHLRAIRAADGSFMMIYIPSGKEISINTKSISGSRINLWWFNPRKGTATNAGARSKTEVLLITPPELNGENDWVLVVDDASKKFGPPGKRK